MDEACEAFGIKCDGKKESKNVLFHCVPHLVNTIEVSQVCAPEGDTDFGCVDMGEGKSDGCDFL
jgi:hypothetical protein